MADNGAYVSIEPGPLRFLGAWWGRAGLPAMSPAPPRQARPPATQSLPAPFPPASLKAPLTEPPTWMTPGEPLSRAWTPSATVNPFSPQSGPIFQV
jgi:hypothetical protein